MTIITMKDLRACGICPESKRWFVEYGLDWRDFVRNGIPVEKLRATGDIPSLINRLEAAAKERIANGKE